MKFFLQLWSFFFNISTMQNELSERLQTFIRMCGITQKHLREKLDISSASMSRMVNGLADIDIAVIQYLLVHHRLSADWFYTGTGDPFRPALPESIAREPDTAYGGDPVEEFRRLVRLLTEIERRLPPSTL